MIRQAHPGPGAPPYRSSEQKMRDAEKFQREEGIPFTVLADDLEGTVHQAYGALPNPAYLIDSDGRVAFYNLWTHAPTLHRQIEALLHQGGRGVAREGYNRTPHFLSAMIKGWKGLQRGWPQSFIELETSAPGMASSLWAGYQFRRLLAPVALHATPLPISARIGLAGLAAGLLLLGLKAFTSPGKKSRLENRRPRGRRHGLC
jgi:hypothetical protein